MRNEYVAIWSPDIERLKDFYVSYFGAVVDDGFENQKKGYKSYYLRFGRLSKLEVMDTDGIQECIDSLSEYTGYSLLTIEVNTVFQFIKLMDRLEQDGYAIIEEPRRIGDGYFESAILDPDANRVEIVKRSINIGSQKHEEGVVQRHRTLTEMFNECH